MGVHRRNLLLSAFAVIGMFTLLGMSCSITSQPYTGSTTAPKLYVGGDSITDEAIDDLNAQFQSTYQVRIEGWGGGDSAQQGPRVIAAATSAPDVAIIELGTNDPVLRSPHNLPLAQTESNLEAMAAAFPSSTCVIFVTPWSGTLDRPPGSLEAIAGFERATFPRIADWDAAVVPEDYAGGDGVHPVESGVLHLMQVEAAAVATCPPPATTTTTTTDTTTSSTDTSTTTTDTSTSTTSTVDTSTTDTTADTSTSTTDTSTSTTSTVDTSTTDTTADTSTSTTDTTPPT